MERGASPGRTVACAAAAQPEPPRYKETQLRAGEAAGCWSMKKIKKIIIIKKMKPLVEYSHAISQGHHSRGIHNAIRRRCGKNKSGYY